MGFVLESAQVCVAGGAQFEVEASIPPSAVPSLSMPLDATEPYADPSGTPLANARTARTAVLSWTDARGAHQALVDGALTVGSSPSCHVVVTDPSVSHMHAGIRPTGEGIEIRDLGRRNGTFGGGLRVREAIAGDEVTLRLGRVELRLHRPIEKSTHDLWPRTEFGPLRGRSEIMRGLFQQLAEIAPNDETIMIRGETGTGKEVVARAIHEHSGRHTGPFIPVDCSTLPENLVESELFGHARGAFSGAGEAHEGAFEAADGGTLFLDEIGELPLSKQAKFLRALEAREIRRVGETHYRPVNVRVLSASHRDLRELVNQGEFREDLYFRLAVIPIRVPPLRERREDIPLLVQHFLDARRSKIEVPRVVMEKLMANAWRGNVRALRNAVVQGAVLGWERMLALRETDGAGPGDDPVAETQAASASVASPEGDVSITSGGFYAARERAKDKFEHDYVVALNAKFPGDKFGAALHAGVHAATLRKMARRHGL